MSEASFNGLGHADFVIPRLGPDKKAVPSTTNPVAAEFLDGVNRRQQNENFAVHHACLDIRFQRLTVDHCDGEELWIP
jgi:hypothetical protein